jgi:hypothetical protein
LTFTVTKLTKVKERFANFEKFVQKAFTSAEELDKARMKLINEQNALIEILEPYAPEEAISKAKKRLIEI